MVPGMMGCVRGRAERVNGVKTGCHSEQDGEELSKCALVYQRPPPSWRNKGQESVRAEQLIEDLWLTEYADLLAVIDHDPHAALGYIFAFRGRENERGMTAWGGHGGTEKSAKGEDNREKNALAN